MFQRRLRGVAIHAGDYHVDLYELDQRLDRGEKVKVEALGWDFGLLRYALGWGPSERVRIALHL